MKGGTQKHFVNVCLPFSLRRILHLQTIRHPGTEPGTRLLVVLITAVTADPYMQACVHHTHTHARTHEAIMEIVLTRDPNCKQQ